jgi:hypothetical protein
MECIFDYTKECTAKEFVSEEFSCYTCNFKRRNINRVKRKTAKKGKN